MALRAAAARAAPQQQALGPRGAVRLPEQGGRALGAEGRAWPSAVGPFRRTGPTAGKGVIVSDDTGIGHFVLSHLD